MMRARRDRLSSWGAALALCGALFGGAPAAAEDGDERLYELQRAERAVRERSFTIDPSPEGKRIAFVELAREDVFVDDELWPTWPNLFHWLTVEETIRRELLFAPGERYDEARVEETMRNLRGLGTFALVRIVPVRAARPDEVGLLVYTRDLWSLRLETAFSGAADAFALSVQLAERNFLGRNKTLAARFRVDPKVFSVGQAYVDPRVLGGQLALQEYFDVFFNRESGHAEGSRGLLKVSQPFRRLSQRWGFTAQASYANLIERALYGAEIATYRPDARGAPDFCERPDPSCLRAVYRDRSVAASLSGSYRRGVAYKQTFSAGLGYADRDVSDVPETELAPGEQALFARLLLPRERRQVYPFVSYSLWLPEFAVLHNLSTYGKSENVRTGPVLDASMNVPLEAFGSSSDSVKFTGELGYVLVSGEALAEASLYGETRLEEGRAVDQRGEALLRGATPPWGLGRLVLYASFEGRRRDTARTQIALGGDNGLRGYASGRFREVGGNRVRANVEYRTLPLVFEAVHFGAVVFYDAGSVYTSVARARLHHAAGAGLRVLFPQFNQSPFRLDVGVPLDEEGFSVLLSYGSAQAVALTAADDAESTGEL